jgi:tRNA A-37 threonylcarbamoyl transferase component Bud32
MTINTGYFDRLLNNFSLISYVTVLKWAVTRMHVADVIHGDLYSDVGVRDCCHSLDEKILAMTMDVIAIQRHIRLRTSSVRNFK